MSMRSEDFREAGVPLLRISCLAGAEATLNGCNYLPPAKVREKWGHFAVKRGDYQFETREIPCFGRPLGGECPPSCLASPVCHPKAPEGCRSPRRSVRLWPALGAPAFGLCQPSGALETGVARRAQTPAAGCAARIGLSPKISS